jgi:RNA polymerase sigma-32 factor
MTKSHRKGKALEKEKRRGSSETKLTVFDPLHMYFAEVKKHPPLSREEEHALAIRFQKKGDAAAASRLVLANLRLVIKIAFEFHRAWANILDLIQEGNIGLMLAVKKFDPYRGIRLPTYATWWIKAYILKFILDNWKLVRVGTTNTRRKLLFNLQKEKDKLERTGFTPEPKLLSSRLNASEKDIIEVEQSLGAADVSLGSAIGDDGRALLIERIASGAKTPSEEAIEHEFNTILQEKFDAFARKLDEKEAYILEKRLLSEDPLTLQEIGEAFQLTREAIRLTEKRLIRKLKAYLKRELKDYKDFEFYIREHPDSTEK